MRQPTLPARASALSVAMRIALLTTDNREDYKDYGAAAPYFGTAPEALLQGFALLSDVEVHVVSCAQQPLAAPATVPTCAMATR